MSSESESSARPVVVSVRDLGKCYEVYARPIDRLKQTLWRGRRRFYREFWALRGVHFELHAGEALGVIGRNGAGKSTLLQLVAGTLDATEGSVSVHGRVAALLELGSGFDYEFTGRQNIVLNGIILGLDERTILERFDEIADFADIGDFIDQPVKTYSTGMVMRLAFAVQVLLEPKVLIIDEALAVGDIAFQVRCMKHMKGLLERGVAVLLVTHDVNTARSFCDRVLWLESGRQQALGDPREVTNRYVSRSLGAEPQSESEHVASDDAAPSNGAAHAATDAKAELPPLPRRAQVGRWGEGWARIERFAVSDREARGGLLEHGEHILVEAELVLLGACNARHVGFTFSFRNVKGLDVICYTTWEAGLRFEQRAPGTRYRVAIELENILAAGDYVATASIEDVQGPERRYADFLENAATFQVASSLPIFSSVLPPVRARLTELSPREPAGR